MKSKCINIAVAIAFLVAGLLVTGSVYAQQDETTARANNATSLHETKQGKITFYSADGSNPNMIGPGYESITGVAYNTLPCASCHDKTKPYPFSDPDNCDRCHTNLVDFSDGPTMPNSTCGGCHGRQNKENAKGFTDVHDTAYPNCVDCHTWKEMHGDGVAYDSMLESGAMETSCENCHTGTSPVGPAVDASHDPHNGKLHCSACHVKSVISCYNCHFDSQVDGVGKFANTALGANDKNAGFVMLMNHEGQVRSGSFQSIVYEAGNEFVVFAPFHGHSVGTGADARTCDDCHLNDNIMEYMDTGKIVLTTWNGSAIVQEATGAVPLIDGAIEMAWLDLLSTGPNVWDFLSTGTGAIQYGYGTPLTEDQINAMGHQPPPPVMQEIGFFDVEFDGLEREDCIVCHTNNVDGHHLLYGSAIPQGLCSYANGTCSEDGVTPCLTDADCTGTCDPVAPGTCLSGSDCTQPIPQCNINGQACPVGLCDDGVTSCQIDSDCVVAGDTCNAAPCAQPWTGQFCGDPVCYGATAAPVTDADSSGTPDTNYGCLNCHPEDNSGGVIEFVVIRDCTTCHVQGLNQPTVHHADELGDAKNAVCTSCHGDVIDDALGCAETTQNVCSIPLDGVEILCEDDTICTNLGIGTCVSAGGCAHDTPTYAPSLVTPDPSAFSLICTGAWGGSGTPCDDNSDCSVPGETCQAAGDAIPGGCNYCHDAGLDIASGKDIHDNYDTHHHSGIYKNRLGGSNDDICLWCHPTGHPHHTSCSNDRSIEDCVTDADCPPGGVCEDPEAPGVGIRGCEVCHGYESLHNIQNDSNGDGIVVGGELAYFGHVGKDDPTNPDNASDCWGCHGFSISGVPASTEVIIPSLSSADKDTIIAGAATALSLTGVAFTNDDYTSICEVVAGDDVVATVIPDSISVGSMDCTIPALGAGNYRVRVRKENVVSNPVAVKCVPAVTIDNVTCEAGVLTITGSGFGEEPPAGAEEFLNVKMGDAALDITSWTDTQIVATTAICGGEVTVNALYGSASAGEDCCEGDIDSDGDVDGSDASGFKSDFGRSQFSDPCTDGTCAGDFDCDGDQDGTDASLFKSDFGRSALSNPCPGCTAADCSY